MNRWFETWRDTAKASFDNGRRFQDAWFKAVGTTCNGKAAACTVPGADVARGYFPVIGRNMELIAEASATAFEAGLGCFRKASELTKRQGKELDWAAGQQLIQCQFDAIESSSRAFTVAFERMADNWSRFVQDAGEQEKSEPAGQA